MFAERLRELRKEHKMTQDELGKHLDLAKSTIAGYETGLRLPPLPTLNKFAKLFNTSSDYLIGLTNDRSPKEPSKDFDQLFKDPDFTYKGQKISQEDTEVIIHYLERILEIKSENKLKDHSDHELAEL